MGNAPTNELWANVYKLRAKELLEYGEMVTDKVQSGELDMTDSKAMAKFRDDFRAAIAQDREKLVAALWDGYSAKKSTIGQAECRNLIKHGLTEAKVNYPETIVKFSEVEVTRTLANKITPLMTDKESRPMWESSLEQIRNDIAERIRNELIDKANEANSIGDKLLARLAAGEGKSDKKDKEIKDSKDIPALGKEDPKFDAKATVTKENFLKFFAAVYELVLQSRELVKSVHAQFESFAEMEVRNIPERVIRKLEEEEEAAEAAEAKKSGAGAGEKSSAGGSPAKKKS